MGKKIVDEDMHLNIKINGNEAKNELFELEEKVRDLSSENEKLERSIQKCEREISKNDNTISRYAKTLDKERENLEKQIKVYTVAHENMSTMLANYKKLDAAGKESTYGKRLLEDIRKQEDIIRRSGESGRKSKQAVDELEKSLKKLGVENEKLTRKRNEDTVSLDKNKSEIEANSGKVEKLRKNLDVTTLSIEELNREITRTSRLFRTTDPNDPKWAEYQRTLIALRKRHQELSAQAQSTRGVLCRMADGLNRYWNLVVSGMASLTGVVFGIKSAINKYVEFTDVLADVRKTTGLTEEGVLELNEELKKVDTRSSQEELMGLARVGGKLGIEGKENLLGFVKAADQINIALKEDLGGDTEEAIRQVGKIVDIFKVNEKFGIEEGMLKVGSVINELGAASTANEGYIVEFTKRVAGIAPMTKIQVADIMGLAATLDKFGQTSEVSSTVYSQVMTQMYKKTGTFAKIAGMEVSAFSGLLKTDANEAFLSVMEGLKGNSAEIENMIASMGDMGMEGKRAVGVLGVLAENTETLREQQALANKSFEEGISLTNEFNIKNNNLAAQRAKAKKYLDERIKQLGEKLQPLLVLCTNSMSLMVRVLGALIDFSGKYGGKVLWLASVIGIYTVALKGSIIGRKIEEALVARAIRFGIQEANGVKALTAAKIIFTGSVKKAAAAVKALSAVMMANPWVTLGTAVAGVVSYLAFFVNRANEAEKSQKRLNEIKNKHVGLLGEEKVSLESLMAQIKQTNPGTERRIELVDELASKFPGLADEQELYMASLQQLTTLEGNYRKELEKRIRLKMNAEQFEDLVRQQQKKEKELEAINKGIARVKKELDNLANYWTGEEGESQKRMARGQVRRLEKRKQELEDALKLLESSKNAIDLTGGDNQRDYDKELEVLKNTYNKKLIQKDVYEKKKNQIELDRMYDSLKNDGLVGEERLQLEQRIQDKLEEMKRKDGGKVELVNTGHDGEILALKEKYANQLITSEEYEAKLDVLELGHMAYRLENEEMTEDKRVQLKQQMADKKIDITKKMQKAIDEIIDVDDKEFSTKLDTEYNTILGNQKLFGQEGKDSMDSVKDYEKEKVRKRRKFGLERTEDEEEEFKTDEDSSLKEQLQARFELINNYEMQGVLAHEEAEKLKTEATKRYNKERLKQTRQGVSVANSLFSAGANVFSMLKEKELAAAGDNEEKKDAIRKKYAKKEQAMAIGQAITSGALAIMRIWEGKITGNPVVDAIIKAALTAAQVAQNIIQVDTIKSQQFEKGRYPVIGKDDGMKYNADFVDRLNTGIYDRPTLGLFSEKKPELVVDGNTTRKLVFNYPRIYRAILDVAGGKTPQFAGGRYPRTTDDGMVVDESRVGGYDPELKQLLQEIMRMMHYLATTPLSAEFTYDSAKRMNKKMKLYEDKIAIKK